MPLEMPIKGLSLSAWIAPWRGGAERSCTELFKEKHMNPLFLLFTVVGWTVDFFNDLFANIITGLLGF